MARCTDCIHFSLCDYNTNISGDSKIKLFYEKGAEKCSFYKPTADIVEVKHGEWIDNHCTVCGKTPLGEELWEHLDLCPPRFELCMDYCPCCNAKMDLKKVRYCTNDD